MSDDSNKSVSQNLSGVLVDFYEWLEDILGDPLVRHTMLVDLGLDPGPLVDENIKPDFPTLDSIRAYRDSAAEDLDGVAFASAVEDIVGTATAVGAFLEALEVSGDDAIEELVHRFFNLMGLNYIRLRFPALYFLAQPFGFIEESISTHESAKFHLERILLAVFDSDTYTDFINEEAAYYALSLQPIAIMMGFLLLREDTSVKVLYGWETLEDTTTPMADLVSERALSFAVSFTHKNEDSDSKIKETIVFTLQRIRKDHGGPGLLITMGAAGGFVASLSKNWQFELKANIASAIDLLIVRGEPQLFGPQDASVKMIVKRKAEGPTEPIVFPGSRNSHLEFGELSFSGELSNRGVDFKITAKNSALVLGNADGDGFIGSILPAGNTRLPFDFGVGVASDRGLYFEGSTGLSANIAINKTIGPLNIQSVTLGLRQASETNNSGAIAEVSADIGLKLGPIDITVQGIGYSTGFGMPNDSGNSVVSNVKLGFKSPTSIGLSIDGSNFKGGGFLSFDDDEQRYVGFLELEFKDKINLKAIGLLTTQLPNGGDGYSLLIIITAEFRPIQLGLGFTLNGVGGLLGLNRTANIERLRSGVKDNTLSSILFPQDIVANAGRILSDLRQVFPPQEGRFIFGPMMKIAWGTPALIIADVGLMIEVPSPVRLHLLGVTRVQIPNEELRLEEEENTGRSVPILIQLQVNFIGVVDFDAQMMAFDASLYDSKILNFILSGDMALRFSWGEESNFLLSYGGFHPSYEPPPPPALPNLQRLTLSLSSGNNPRITLETYYAVTSNTVQFGSRLELYAEKSKFNVSGFLSYDVLFQFNPFYFIADMRAMLALRVGSREIASINLSLTLDGPTPWHAKGNAKLKICWFFTLKVSFNKTFGNELGTRLDDVAVLPLLRAALSDKGNWEATLPNGGRALVSVKDVALGVDDIVIDPNGILSISQKVVPLKTSIHKFGSQLPSDAHHFEIEKVMVGEGSDAEFFDTTSTQESFAPAQFFEKTDTQKLSSPSFERLDNGVRLAQSEKMHASYSALRKVKYELFYSDEQRNQPIRRRPGLYDPDKQAFNTLANKGAVAASTLSYDNKPKPATAPDAVKVRGERFTVVNIKDMKAVSTESPVESETGAYQLMNEILDNNPALVGELQVIPTYEMGGVIGL